MKRPKQSSYKREQRHLTNKQCLRYDKVRLIDIDKTNHGVLPTGRALRIAEDQQLDLICMNPTGNPPVCKVGDYSKIIFDEKKAKRLQKKLQTKNVLKEMDFRPAIQDHDFDTKCRKIKDFINKGNKVKSSLPVDHAPNNHAPRNWPMQDDEDWIFTKDAFVKFACFDKIQTYIFHICFLKHRLHIS